MVYMEIFYGLTRFMPYTHEYVYMYWIYMHTCVIDMFLGMSHFLFNGGFDFRGDSMLSLILLTKRRVEIHRA